MVWLETICPVQVMAKASKANQPESGALDLSDQFDQGIINFSILFTRWMDTNEWSHPAMTALAKAAAGNVGWLHSSQISGLRHAKLKNPGPRTFIVIERLNFYLHRYLTQKTLIPNTTSSRSYATGWAIIEDGVPPSVGWWFEVFCGSRLPKDIDLGKLVFTPQQAKNFSEAFGRLARVLIAKQGFDLIEDLKRLVRDHYTAGDDDRVTKVVQVIRKESVWTPDEISYEMPSLLALTAELGGPDTESLLLETLDLG